jgi:hypothetical protein
LAAQRVLGAWTGGRAFILPNFLIVAALGATYVHFGGLGRMTGIGHRVDPLPNPSADMGLVKFEDGIGARIGEKTDPDRSRDPLQLLMTPEPRTTRVFTGASA